MLLFVEVAFSCVVWHFIKSVVVLLTNGKLPLNGTLFFYFRWFFVYSRIIKAFFVVSYKKNLPVISLNLLQFSACNYTIVLLRKYLYKL